MLDVTTAAWAITLCAILALFFLDLGVAFLGAPGFRLETEGGTLSDDSGPLRTALDAEAAQFEEDAGRYLELWPILSLGLRIGIG